MTAVKQAIVDALAQTLGRRFRPATLDELAA